MLFVHFTPKSNINKIKRKGIQPREVKQFPYLSNGVFLFPFFRDKKKETNIWNWPHFWLQGTAKNQKEMGKILIRIPNNEYITFFIDKIKKWDDSKKYLEIEGEQKKSYYDTVKEFAVRLHDAEVWLKEYHKAWTEYHNSYRHDASYYQVLYHKKIPLKWIIRIYDHTNTDEKSKRCKRAPKHKYE